VADLAPELFPALDGFRAGLVRRYGEKSTAYEVDHAIEGVRMLQSLFPPKDLKAANQYRIVAVGVEMTVKHLTEIAADIDKQETEDLT
jgi:hypothetical protein